VYQKPLDSTGNSFWQPSTTARVKGSGIGLSVSKLLSVQLGGSLRLYRDNLADETVYALRIPLDIPTAKEASTPTGQECRVRMDHLASASHQEQHSPRIVAQPIVEHATTFNAVNQITEMQPKNRPDDVFPDQTDLPALSVSNDVNTLMTSKPFQRRADLRIIPPTSATEPATASSAACLIPLPVLDTQVLAVNTTNRLEETTPSPHPLNIIYADDELSNRKLFIRMLSKLGHNVVRVVDDGDSLLQALGYSITTATTSPLGDTAKTEISPQTVSLMPPTTSALPPVDVIFSDIVMQRIEGTEACRALRAAGCNIPIFAATGNANSWELLREVGFTGILPKPFTIHSIQACLDAIKPSSTNHS
jgi:CheY-like chemotaxis protein